MRKRRETHKPLPVPNRTIGWLIVWCTAAGILIDVVIFKALGAW